MDLGLVVAVVMLVAWAVAALVYNGPGWVHLLLTVGMFLLIWRISVITVRGRSKQRG
jgi:hypothetical protein